MYKLGLCVLIAVVAANDLAVGPQGGGEKIHEQKLQASPAIWRQDKNFTFNATEGHIITRVIITDLRPEKDGEAKIVEGGAGYKNVTIELQSPAVFRGFEFNVEVYAAPDNNKHVDQQTSQHKPQVPTQEPEAPIFVVGNDSDDTQQSASGQQQTSQQTPPVPTQEPKVTIPVIGDVTEGKHQSVSVVQQTTQQTAQVPTQEPKVPISVGNDSDDKQQTVPVEQQIPQHTQQVPTQEPKVPVPVDGDDSLRKPRETEEDKKQNVTPQVYVSVSTTAAPASSEPTPTPTQVQEENGQKINIPVDLGKDVTSTPKSAEPAQKEESDVVDPVAVHQQPTHLNNTEKVASTVAPQQVPKEVSSHPQFRDFPQTESTTEAVTSTTVNYVDRSTIIDGKVYVTRILNDAPFAYLEPPKVNVQGLSPSKTIVAKNGPVLTHQMAPLPYNH